MAFKLRGWLFPLLLFLPLSAFAYNYPATDWKVAETEHFVIIYSKETAWTARKVVAIADDVYKAVTDFYDHRPQRKTTVVLRDDEDTSNGYAIYSLGFITLWASPSSLSLRGRHDWIQEVLTHEFAHVVSLQASSGTGWMVEGIRMGGKSDANTNANLNFGGQAFIPTHPYARWWAEGTAQLAATIAGHDTWDSNRDMLLRAATLEDNLLSFDEMRNITVRKHFGGELVYNQGFSFLLWLREKFGEETENKIVDAAQSGWVLDFDRNLEKAFHMPARQLHQEWETDLKKHYQSQIVALQENPIEGERIELISEATLKTLPPDERPYADGLFNAHPRFSPDGHWFSWVDRGTVRLKYLDKPFTISEPKSLEEEKNEVDQPIGLTLSLTAGCYSWAPDSQEIVLCRKKTNVLSGYPYHDLYRFDLRPQLELRKKYLTDFASAKDKKARKEVSSSYTWKRQGLITKPKRLTRKLRGTHLAWSPDGKSLALIQNRDGHRHLCLADRNGKNLRDLVAIGGDAEALDPKWSPDGRMIVFTLFNHDQSDIWLVHVPRGELSPLTLDKADDRQPTFSPDGETIYFVSDRGGFSQIYRLPLEAEIGTEPEPVTQVTTGAFMPFVAPDNTLLYAKFSSFGYKPYRLSLTPPSKQTAENAGTEEIKLEDNPEEVEESKKDLAKQQLTAESYPSLPEKSYFPWPRPIRLFPTAIWDNNQYMVGLAGQLSDYLEKHNFTGSFLFGRDQDYQISYTNRMFWADIFATYTGYVRNNRARYFSDGDDLLDEPEAVIRDDIQFVDAGMRQEFSARQGLVGTHWLSARYNRRAVNRRIGYPFVNDNEVLTEFRLLTNNGFTLEWEYEKIPTRRGRDFDINPRGATYATITYSLVNTDLFSADPTIPTPNKNYWHHEGTLSIEKYFAMPWKGKNWNQHTYWIRFVGGIKSRNTNYNDEFFLGGRLNFRAFGEIVQSTLFYGYEPFSIHGETMFLVSTGYDFPIIRKIDKKWWWFYFDSVYANIFGEAGNAWNFGQVKNLNQNPNGVPSLKPDGTYAGTHVLYDIGAEIRVKMFLFTDWNRWSSLFRVAYGFQDDAAHGFSDDDLPVRFFVGIGTNF